MKRLSLKNANYPWFIIHGRLRVIRFIAVGMNSNLSKSDLTIPAINVFRQWSCVLLPLQFNEPIYRFSNTWAQVGRNNHFSGRHIYHISIYIVSVAIVDICKFFRDTKFLRRWTPASRSPRQEAPIRGCRLLFVYSYKELTSKYP